MEVWETWGFRDPGINIAWKTFHIWQIGLVHSKGIEGYPCDLSES